MDKNFEFTFSYFRHITVSTGPNQNFLFTVKTGPVQRGQVGFNLLQRKWATLSLGQEIRVDPYYFDPSSSTDILCTMVLEADFLSKKT